MCGEAYLWKGDKWMFVDNEVQQKFDHDLAFGKLGEDFVKNFQSENNKIEVKTERDIWKTTGNIAIEIRCRGKKSGISVTEAETWIHLLSYKNKEVKVVMGGDNDLSQMVLIPINKIFT